MANYCRNDIFLSATESEWNEIDFAFSHHRIDWDPTTDGVERYSRDKKLYFCTQWGPVSTYSGCLPDLSRLYPTVIFFYENETEGEYKVYSDWICNGICGHKAKSIKAMENACNVEVKRAFESRNDAAEGIRHRVEIMPDGRVAADGENRFGECNIFSWNSIVQVSCGNWHTVGLKNDGTIVSCGSNANGQCDVTDYQKKAIAVSCGRYHTAVLFSDGHVKVAGRLEQKVSIRPSDEEDPMPEDMFPLVERITLNKSISGWKKMNQRIEKLSDGEELSLTFVENYVGCHMDVFNKAGEKLGEIQTANVIALSNTLEHLRAYATNVTPLAQRRKGAKYASMSVRFKFIDTGQQETKESEICPSDFKQTDVSEWENVVKIHSVFDAVIGITSEGTMLIDGYCPCDKSMLCELMGLSE